MDYRLRRCVFGFLTLLQICPPLHVTFLAHELGLTVQAKGKKRRGGDEDDDADKPRDVYQSVSAYISLDQQ